MSDAISYRQRPSASLGATTGIGAGGGAIVGALASLLREKPSLTKILKDSLVGAAGGAALGAATQLIPEKVDVKTTTSQAGATETLPATTSSTNIAPKNNQMNLGIAALTGLLPPIAPAVHGALATTSPENMKDVASNFGQGIGSGAASLAGPTLIARHHLSNKLPMGAGARIAMPLTAILGAVGAAAAGNKLRED